MSRWFRSYGFAEVLDGLVVGAYPLDEGDVSVLARDGIRRVLNLTEDQEYRPGDREEVERACGPAALTRGRVGDNSRFPRVISRGTRPGPAAS